MKFFKNRTVALILCLLIVVGSTLLNTRVKLGGLCRDTAQAFYEEDGIAAQLATLHDEAETLAALAESKGLDAAALRTASQDLQGMLSQRSIAAGSLYPYYDALNSELKKVETRLMTAGLSDRDANTLSTSLERIHTAQATIVASSYNADVRSFLQENDRFPTDVLAKLAGVELPEEFA